MRGLTLVALLMVGALVLSGCSSKSDSTTSASGSKTGTGTKGTNGTVVTNTTTQAPNVPPLVVVHSTNATGVPTNVTFVNGALTFSAAGSSDPDGDGLSAVAIVAQDSNRTYPPGVLFAAGKFTSVTYKFDRPGVVNVTVSGIDVRGDLTTVKVQVFVDEKITVTSQSINVLSTGGIPSAATDCVGPGSSSPAGSGGSVLDATSFDHQPFNVAKGAQYIVATHVSGDGKFAICGPDGKAASKEGDKSTPAEADGPLATPKGLESYQMGFVANGPGEKVVVTVIVHYEPKAAK
ncbi:MAG TPA: hypothetical protein VM327_09545 [Candidatus Thermoplasmatota archaeon]|nr:hypothetical protein [Candidatus Thermoplasmatota archaeon]